MAISFFLRFSTQVCELLLYSNFYTAILDMGLPSYISTASLPIQCCSVLPSMFAVKTCFPEKVDILQYVLLETFKITSKGYI